MATVPRLLQYYEGATTPEPASRRLIVSRSGTVRACSFVSSPWRSRCPQAGPRPGLGLKPVHPHRLCLARTCSGLPGSLASHPAALRRSPTPADPWRLAIPGASGAAPILTRMKASTMLFRGSIAPLRHPLCTLHDVRCRTPCNTRFRLAGCAFAGRESNPLARDEGFLAHRFPPSRTSPGATSIRMRRGKAAARNGGRA